MEEESEKTSPLEVGLRLRISSSTLGSITSRGRSSQPLAVLKFARASVALSFLPIYSIVRVGVVPAGCVYHTFPT